MVGVLLIWLAFYVLSLHLVLLRGVELRNVATGIGWESDALCSGASGVSAEYFDLSYDKWYHNGVLNGGQQNGTARLYTTIQENAQDDSLLLKNNRCGFGLNDLFDYRGSDKGTMVHNYGLIYDVIFAHPPARFSVKYVLEIGVGSFQKKEGSMHNYANGVLPKQHQGLLTSPRGTHSEIHYTKGASLLGWRDFFPNAMVTGFDIKEDVMFAENEEERVRTFLVDAGNKREILKALEKMFGNLESALGKIDVIIDDGSHAATDQRRGIQYLWPFLKKGSGVYIIEDVAEEDVVDYHHKLIQDVRENPDPLALGRRLNAFYAGTGYGYGDAILVIRKDMSAPPCIPFYNPRVPRPRKFSYNSTYLAALHVTCFKGLL